jgi:hypothetical protein
MRTTTALLVTIGLALPAVATPHPCEAEVAQMRKDLDAIRGAVASIEAVPASDMQRQMLAGAKGKYDLERRRLNEAQARCDRLLREENPGGMPSAPEVRVPAPAPAALAAPAVEAPDAPCLTGCGKDTDCKGDRICVNGACQDPPSR